MTQQAAILADESDDQLVARIAARDHVAMRRAAELYAQLAWRVAYRMLGDASEAEDVAQESLLRLWNHADRWKAGGAGIAPWLKKVTVNQCLDRLRRKRFVSEDEAPEREDEEPVTRHDDPGGVDDSSERRRDRVGLGAPDHLRDVAQDEAYAECQK